MNRTSLSQREAVIATLLERYHELTDPMQPRAGTGDGTSLPLMPPTWTPSVREVERLMQLLRVERRDLWWHVHHQYIACEYVTRDIPIKRKVKPGRTITVIERKPVARVHVRVTASLVGLGLTWMAERWRLPHEPFLPKELKIA